MVNKNKLKRKPAPIVKNQPKKEEQIVESESEEEEVCITRGLRL